MKMLWMIGVLLLCAFTDPARAVYLDPLNFSSFGTLSTVGTLTINTDTLQIGGAASITGLLDPSSQAAVFDFDGIQTADISVSGSRPLALLSRGNATLGGTISVLGRGALDLGAVGTLEVNNISTNGGELLLSANQINLTGQIVTENGGSTQINSATDILVGSGGSGITSSGSITLTSGSGQNSTYPSGGNLVLTGGTLDLGAISLGTISVVPLPPSIALFGSGLLGVASWLMLRGRHRNLMSHRLAASEGAIK